jgi:ankyrin repeat protein
VYLQTKVLVLPFADHLQCNETLEQLDNIIRHLEGRAQLLVTERISEPHRRRHRDGILEEERQRLDTLILADDAEQLKSYLSNLEYQQPPSSPTQPMGIGIFRPSTQSASDDQHSESGGGGGIVSPSKLPISPVSNITTRQQKLNDGSHHRLLTSLLFLACQHRAYKCIRHLVDSKANVSGVDDVNERTLIHKIVLCGGQLDCYDPRPSPTSLPSTPSSNGNELLKFLLDASPSASSCLTVADIFGRIPLHYAAMNGYADMARVLVEKHREMQHRATPDFESEFVKCRAHGASWLDYEGHSPLFYAVIYGFTDVVAALLDVQDVDVDDLPVGTLIFISSSIA